MNRYKREKKKERDEDVGGRQWKEKRVKRNNSKEENLKERNKKKVGARQEDVSGSKRKGKEQEEEGEGVIKRQFGKKRKEKE